MSALGEEETLNATSTAGNVLEKSLVGELAGEWGKGV